MAYDMITAVRCPRCALLHLPMPEACPQVKAVEYDASRSITRIEYLTPNDFPKQQAAPDAEVPYDKLKPRSA